MLIEIVALGKVVVAVEIAAVAVFIANLTCSSGW